MMMFEFILVMVAMGMIFTLIKHRMGIREDRHGNSVGPAENSAETRALRDDVEKLKGRIAVLERITVDKEHGLAREIEDLRGSPTLVAPAAVREKVQ